MKTELHGKRISHLEGRGKHKNAPASLLNDVDEIQRQIMLIDSYLDPTHTLPMNAFIEKLRNMKKSEIPHGVDFRLIPELIEYLPYLIKGDR